MKILNLYTAGNWNTKSNTEYIWILCKNEMKFTSIKENILKKSAKKKHESYIPFYQNVLLSHFLLGYVKCGSSSVLNETVVT